MNDEFYWVLLFDQSATGIFSPKKFSEVHTSSAASQKLAPDRHSIYSPKILSICDLVYPDEENLGKS